MEQSNIALNGATNGVVNGGVLKLPSIGVSSVAINGETTGAESDTNLNASEPAYQIRESPMGTRRRLRVIFMGMGAAGINFAHHLEKQGQNVELAIYEKNQGLGGTWLENRYPGCACDIPSVSYQFTWHRKPDWSHYYSSSKEIHEYFKNVSETYKLERFVKYNHKIVHAEWVEAEGQWKVKIMRNNNPNDIIEDSGDFFLNGGGFLNSWKWPIIEGLDSFNGPRIHSANWDDGVDLTGKKVLVIGAGSSGVQIVPAILPKVEKLFVVARSPTWITAGFAPKYAGPNGGNFAYSEDTMQTFRRDPIYYLAYCKAIESELNLRFKIAVNDSPDAIEARKYSIQEMSRKLASRPDLLDKLMPKNFGIGCRRPTPGNGFLEALTHDKTTTFTSNIKKITDTGFVDPDGQEHQVDVIVCATGFDTSFRPQFPVIANGRNVQNDFDSGDTIGYLGFSLPNVPNYFSFSGPYGPLGHGSALPMIEAYTNYILQVFDKVQVEDIKKLQVKYSAAEQFTRHSDVYLQRTAWSGPCSSWFKAGDKARKPVLWPGSRIHYLTVLQKPRYEDYDIQYISNNAFNFLGDGFDIRESDGRDLTWYYGLLNGEDKQPRYFPPPLY